jgi:hypothetical protein
MKRILFSLAVFFVGVAIGAVSCWLYFGQTMRDMLVVGQDMFASGLYTYESKEADSQFLNPNRDVAIYALDRAVRHLSEFQTPRTATCRTTAYKLGKFNVRLAELYKVAGNQEPRERHMQNALASYEAMGWKLRGIGELEKAIPLIEADRTAEALKAYGELITPCDMK